MRSNNPKLVTGLVKFYEKQYALPKNGIFTLYEPWIRKFTLNLFDVFYFAKDFETFFKAASWAKKHVEPVLFVFAYTLALYHRPDTQSFTVPPMYEVFPDYFLPQETIHEIFKTKLMDIKDFEFNYNNSGCEYNYNSESFGGVLDYSINNQHLEYKLSYFREDIGLNSWYLAWQRKYPGWLASKKYGKDFWFKRGEGFYYTHHQLLARLVSNNIPR
ncbi:unnamed protein product [Nesidiocoris tenuis]|uniref:Hemocyanin/hexamerin middle domain-containing protein n=1 Tax=Nesidiocoris tenuis TaxID=355587 RepID=A0A6H5GDL4_9HEMI|nr:unnamed protein product [Nesidiocoris tenuis]